MIFYTLQVIIYLQFKKIFTKIETNSKNTGVYTENKEERKKTKINSSLVTKNNLNNILIWGKLGRF